ncbi:gluzincin family metallopeptidase [Isoptericola aurantiacus]|uniref:hypothetical protein n=1 Tax=Isoptericola aurantiacus TaxID=3377839 RepID=UPI00383A31A6
MAGAETHRPYEAGRALRRAGTVVLALALGLGALLVAPGAVAPAAAQDGLTEESHARYEVTAKGKVSASVTTTITNVTPDVGNRYYYWNRYGIAVPASAKDVRATSWGSPLTVDLEADPEDPNVRWARVGFSPLRYGSTRTIEWTYEIAGSPVRSDRWTRAGRGYATFSAQALGDPGRVSVEVVAPTSMTFDSTEEFTSRKAGGKKTLYRSEEYSEGWGVWSAVSVRDPRKTDEQDVTVGDTTLTVQSFPGDTTWRKFAADRIVTGLPVLEDLLDEPWPGRIAVVREDVSPQVLGYAWFDDQGDEIVVGEELDESTLYHELGHAWFDDERFVGRWLYEGLTELTAYRVIDAVDGEGEPRQAPRRQAAGSLPLLDWSELDREPTTETYAYAAAYTALHRMLGDLDDETYSAVVAAAYAGESAYEEPGSTTKNFGRTDWRRFLDLAAERGGVDGTDQYRTWVVKKAQAKKLDARADARTDYADLDEADGAWQAPVGLRRDMTDWSFGDAEDAMTLLLPIAPQAVAVQDTAARTGLAVPESVRTAYEDAETDGDYRALETLLPQAADALEDVDAAERAATADVDPVSELGQAVLEVDDTADAALAALSAGELDDARALAAETTDGADRALWTGLGVVAGALLLLALLVLVPVLIVRWRRRRRRRRAWNPTPGEPFAVLTAPGASPQPAAAPESPDVAPDAPGDDGAARDGSPNEADAALDDAGTERGIDHPVP